MDKKFKIQARGGGNGEVLLYGDIEDAKGFIDQLNALGSLSSLDIRINSPGGSVFEGIAIFNGLERHRARKNVYVDGLAASIASLIAMVGEKIVMAENSSMMIHNPYGAVVGEVSDMHKMAETLAKIKKSMIETYVKKTKLSKDEVSDMMDDETWMTAQEAVKMGFATEVSRPIEAQIFNLSTYGYRNAPVLNVSKGRTSSGGSRDEAALALLDEIDFSHFKTLKNLSAKIRYEYFKKEADLALKELSDQTLNWARRQGFLDK